MDFFNYFIFWEKFDIFSMSWYTAIDDGKILFWSFYVSLSTKMWKISKKSKFWYSLSILWAVKKRHISRSLTEHWASYVLKLVFYKKASTLSFLTIPNSLDILKIGKRYKQKCKIWTHQLDQIWHFFSFLAINQTNLTQS